MSREPSSAMHRGWNSYEAPPAPPKPTKPKRGKGKKIRVRMEPTKKREQAVNKLLLSTEALTPEERKIVRGYRISRRDLGLDD